MNIWTEIARKQRYCDLGLTDVTKLLGLCLPYAYCVSISLPAHVPQESLSDVSVNISGDKLEVSFSGYSPVLKTIPK